MKVAKARGIEILRTNVFLSIAFFIVFGQGCDRPAKSELNPITDANPTPTVRAIKAVDIVERADAMCKKEGDCRQAILLYSQGIEERGQSVELLKKRGMAYYALQAFEPAVKVFSTAISLEKKDEKKDPDLYFIRGLTRSLLENEDRRGACSDLREAIRLGWRSDDPGFDSWYADYCSVSK